MPFRIAGSHTDENHKDSAVFQAAGPFDSSEEAWAVMPTIPLRFGDGYTFEVQELIVSDDGESAEWSAAPPAETPVDGGNP